VADSDHSGVLEPEQAANALKLSGFKLDDATVKTLIAAADVDHDGVIEYAEFVPMILSVLQPGKEDSANMPSPAALDLTKYSPAELNSYFHHLFAVADSDHSGVLEPEQAANALKLSGFKLDDATVKTLIAAADVDHDGVIEYAEFVPMILSELQKNKVALDLTKYSLDQLQGYFTKLFQIADANGDGVISPDELQNLLEVSGFPFSADMVGEIMNAADVNHDGVLSYEEFVPVMLRLLEVAPGGT